MRYGDMAIPPPRDVDPCPKCGAAVTAVEATNPGQTFTSPCGHRVIVTMWPERVELTLP